MLRRALRTVVAILALLPLQFPGTGHAVACARGGHDATGTAMGMPGMAASGAATAASSEAVLEASVPLHVRPADDATCDHGEAPRGCMAAPACAAVVLALPRAEQEVALVAHPDGLPPLTMLAPASVTHPPDLRPPRA